MKKIKEAVINADPRMKGLLVVMIAYIGIVATTLNAGATNQIDNYVETIDVKVQDGNQDQKDYLIRQASVSSVLDDLKISVNPQDILNLDLNYIVNKGDLIQITRINQADIRRDDYSRIKYGKYNWIRVIYYESCATRAKRASEKHLPRNL